VKNWNPRCEAFLVRTYPTDPLSELSSRPAPTCPDVGQTARTPCFRNVVQSPYFNISMLVLRKAFASVSRRCLLALSRYGYQAVRRGLGVEPPLLLRNRKRSQKRTDPSHTLLTPFFEWKNHPFSRFLGNVYRTNRTDCPPSLALYTRQDPRFSRPIAQKRIDTTKP
jgi:hypothetical protein